MRRFRTVTRGAGTSAKVLAYIWQHPANRSHRFRAIARAVKFQLRGRILRRRTLTPVGSHSRLWAELHYHAGALAVYANPPDWNEMQAWKKLLREGDLFIDVGANVGSYTVWASDCGAEVIALEPDPDAYARLVTNAEMASTTVTVLNVAAAAEHCTVSLTVGLNTMNRIVLKGGDGIETQIVPAVTLDELIGDRCVRGIKIDVEGSERLVLEGAARALREHRIEMVQIEWNSMSMECLAETREPVATLLAGFRYALFRPNRRGVLLPLVDTGFGPDVFSCPVPAHLGS